MVQVNIPTMPFLTNENIKNAFPVKKMTASAKDLQTFVQLPILMPINVREHLLKKIRQMEVQIVRVFLLVRL
jgi:hypothetical protein